MELEHIPGPTGLPFLGNLLEMRDDEAPLRALERLTETYGSIFQVTVGGRRSIVVSSAELMKEALDEKRFMKDAIPGLGGKVNGLVAASTMDPDWEQAHRILRPAFGALQIQDMFHDMKDIAHQLILKWTRFGGDEEIELTDDLSNLTLDTIALCTMNYRFNSFYRGGMHPFVAAMSLSLAAPQLRRQKVPVVSTAMSMIGAGGEVLDEAAVAEAHRFMRKTAQEIIDYRRGKDSKKHDFLDTLLFGKDPKTGQVMSDDLISQQMQAFLIAGHETTSGLLSFAIMLLLQNPDTYHAAREEVDRVAGTNSVTLQHIRELKYVYAVLQETLRLFPTAPTIGKIAHPKLQGEIVTLGGKYKVEQTDRIRILFGKSMQDPKVFGEDAREFKPERMLESHPRYAAIETYWRPFSEGMRGCIGRPLAIQESLLAMALILQNFDLRLTNPMYKLRIKQSITIKPQGISIKASLRNGMTPLDLERRLYNGGARTTRAEEMTSPEGINSVAQRGSPLRILFGSNTGTCQALAQRLAAEATYSCGFAPTVDEMDAAVDNLNNNTPLVIITASYEGEPPDNALQFVKYLEALNDQELKGIKYATFGCGDKSWHATFHRVPKAVDDAFKARGADQIVELGVCDVSQGNPMAIFEIWLDKELLPALKKLSPQPMDVSAENDIGVIEAEISTGDRVAILHQELQVGTVKEVRMLTAPGEEVVKRHMEIELPENMSYECGDYLAILPQSPEANVRAIVSYFKLPADATIVLKSVTFARLPLNTPLSIADLLRNYVELAQPATRRAITFGLKYTKDESTKKQLSRWLDDEQSFRLHVTESRLSVFDILKAYPGIDMPFPVFFWLLSPLSIRQYSISSSPLRDPRACTITYSVVNSSENSQTPFYGVATTYLSSLKPGDKIQVSTRRTAKQRFRLPVDTENTPLLMFAAGTGLAPFRGFIEQRAIQLTANPNRRLAPAHLFLGCRSADSDRLYANQMDAWAKAGAVKVYYSFSRDPERSDGCKHVSDRMLKEIETISAAWMAGAHAYICGSRAFAQSVGEAAREIVTKRVDARSADECNDEQVKERKGRIYSSFSERAADDVFE